MNIDNHFLKLENIMSKRLKERKMHGATIPNQLYTISQSLKDGSTIMIVTGFCIRHSLTGETDGPVGAIGLANALEKLGKKVVLVTDKYSLNQLLAGKKYFNLNATILEVYEQTDEKKYHNWFKKYNPSHIVAIERPGRNIYGECHSMRGEIITDLVPDTDLLIKIGKKKNIPFIAIGDGGNEVGMGLISDYVAKNITHGDLIYAELAADYLLVCGVSNWGAATIVAGISLLSKKQLVQTEKEEFDILEAIVEAGAVDGVTKKRVMTVDGYSLEENLKIISDLRSVVYEYL